MKKQNKRDILFLCQYFYPENNSSATLPFDTACALAAEGYSVSALCGMPKEYSSKRKAPTREDVSNVRIHRLRYLQASRKKRFGRLLNFFSFTLRVLFSLPELRRHRMLLVYSNPPVLPVAAVLANRLFGTKFVFISYDIYPEIAIEMDSISKGGAIDRVMTRINRQVFHRAAAVVALSEEMRTALLRLRPQLAESRVTVLHNWAHEELSACDKTTDDILTVGYFGNLGIVQDMDTMLDAMDRLRSNQRIRFLVVGHGSGFEQFRDRTAAWPNVTVESFLTGEALQKALCACDCCVVTLRAGLCGLCMPSKYYSYLQAGTAVISIMEPESELSMEIVRENIGAAVAPGDVEDFCWILNSMADDLPAVRAAGERAAALYESKYQKKLAMERYTSLIRHMLEEV